MHSQVAELAEAATSPSMSLRAFRLEALCRLDKIIGCESASLCQITNPQQDNEPVIVGSFQHKDWDAYCHNWSAYWGELQLLARGGYLLGDICIHDPRTGCLLTVYEDIVRPCGMRFLLGLPIIVSKDRTSVLTMMRPRRRRCFSDKDALAARSLQAVISLGENYLWRPNRNSLNLLGSDLGAVELGRLTLRELEIAQYVALGLTNAQIALACGKSAATVHNQLISIFRKLAVGSRSELVRVLLTEGRGKY